MDDLIARKTGMENSHIIIHIMPEIKIENCELALIFHILLTGIYLMGLKIGKQLKILQNFLDF